MKRLTILLFLVAVYSIGYTQNSLLIDGYRWHYYAYQATPIYADNSINIKAEYVVECDGDTLINNNLYKKFYREFDGGNVKTCVGFLRESYGKVFGIPNDAYHASDNDFIETYIHPYDIVFRQKQSQSVENEYLMYDFNSEIPTGTQEENWTLKSKYYCDASHKMWQSMLNIIVEGVGPDFMGDILCPTLDEAATDLCRTGLSHITNTDNDTIYKGELFGVDKEYTPLLNENYKWVYYSYDPHNLDNYSFYSLSINGDTVINHIKYKKLIKQPYPYAQDGKTVAGILEKRFNDLNDFYEIIVCPLDNNNLYSDNYSPVMGMDSYIIYSFNRLTMMPGPYINREYDRTYSHFDIELLEDRLCKGLFLNDKERLFEGIGYDGYYGDLITPMLQSDGSEDNLYGLSHIEDKSGGVIYQGYYYDSEKLEFAKIDHTEIDKQVSSVRYYNLAGVESVEPQDGVSIKFTTYSDGSRKSEKVLKK